MFIKLIGITLFYTIQAAPSDIFLDVIVKIRKNKNPALCQSKKKTTCSTGCSDPETMKIMTLSQCGSLEALAAPPNWLFSMKMDLLPLTTI